MKPLKNTATSPASENKQTAVGGRSAPACCVSADYLLDNSWAFDIEGWWEATKDGKHRQFVRIRLDIEKQEYVLDVIGQRTNESESLWRYKGGDWQFLSHNSQADRPNGSV